MPKIGLVGFPVRMSREQTAEMDYRRSFAFHACSMPEGILRGFVVFKNVD
jgi:hypothetical protein